MFKKYMNEFMAASKLAFFFAIGLLIATGVVPAILSETRAEATAQFVSSLYGILTSYCGAVLLLWAAEIFRTKRREKKKAEKKAARMAAKKAKAAREAAAVDAQPVDNTEVAAEEK